jgi:flagellar hook-associated protein 1 FlgK
VSNFSARILGSALSALKAQQAKLAVASNNIANAQTPGYSRRVVNLSEKSSLDSSNFRGLGYGVEIQSVRRVTDSLLHRNLLIETSQLNFHSSQKSLLEKLDALFGINGVGGALQAKIDEFFQSLENAAQNPSSSAYRQAVIQKGSLLADTIRLTFSSLAAAQREANSLLLDHVEKVNQLTSQIAALNQQIAGFEAQNGHESALDLRDQRDALLQQLARYVNFDTVETSNGQVSIFLKNGIALVNGSNTLELKALTNPSFVSTPLPALDGGALHYVVAELSPGAHIDLSEVLKDSGGSIGGLLKFRGTATTATSALNVEGSVVSVARKIESLARFFLTTVNQIYRGWDPNLPSNGDENPGTPGVFDASSVDLYGNSPGVYGLFGASGITLTDTNGDGLPNDLPNNTTLADKLQFLVSDPNSLAFARDLDPTPGSVTFAPGDGTIAANLAALRYQNHLFSAPNFSYNGKISDVVNLTNSQVGALVSSNSQNTAYSSARVEFFTQKLEEVRGVDTDEELAKIIEAQRYYEMASKLIRISDNLLETILRVI